MSIRPGMCGAKYSPHFTWTCSEKVSPRSASDLAGALFLAAPANFGKPPGPLCARA